MTLSSGTRLGPYEILSSLGAGGMGEVYRALDKKLDRDVAVKVLPQAVAADADALSRFEREVKAVAALSHPNILAIHDFGTDEGTSYAVMELLEGETLRGRLDSGPIAQRQAADYALQIARRLSAAHEKGIVHRDLKPENLFVGKDGHIKILDFGLAKKVEAVPAEEQTSAPTGSGHTEPGVVMGTAGYMSPEQVKGLPVDHRSDIGEPEKALDQLEPLLKIPCYLSPGWLAIDPQLRPAAQEPEVPEARRRREVILSRRAGIRASCGTARWRRRGGPSPPWAARCGWAPPG